MPTPTPQTVLASIRDRPAVWAAGFWLLVGAAAGTTAYLAAGASARAVGWLEFATPPLLASLCWFPLTLGIFALARRLPVREPGLRRAIAAWALVALTVSFMLNGMYAMVAAVAGAVEWSRVGAITLRQGLFWMHINAGTALVLGGIGHLLARRPQAEDDAAPVRLRVTSGSRAAWLPIEQIDWIEGAGDYARLHADGREVLSDRRLKELEETLRSRRFARIHRSTIVNLDRIRALRHVSHGDYEAELTTGVRLRVARGRRDALLTEMERFRNPEEPPAG